MTKEFSSETRKVIPLTRASSEASTGRSATVDAIREAGCLPEAGIHAALGARLREPLPTSWIERVAPSTAPDTAALLDALDDDRRAFEIRVRSAELELVHKCALIEALGHEQERLQNEVARLEEELIELDAEMFLCLARDRESAAHTAIRRIIARRRHLGMLRSGVERLAAERLRLAFSVWRQSSTFRELVDRSCPAPFDCSARRSPGLPGFAFSSASPAPGNAGRRSASRDDRPEESF